MPPLSAHAPETITAVREFLDEQLFTLQQSGVTLRSQAIDINSEHMFGSTFRDTCTEIEYGEPQLRSSGPLHETELEAWGQGDHLADLQVFTIKSHLPKGDEHCECAPPGNQLPPFISLAIGYAAIARTDTGIHTRRAKYTAALNRVNNWNPDINPHVSLMLDREIHTSTASTSAEHIRDGSEQIRTTVSSAPLTKEMLGTVGFDYMKSAVNLRVSLRKQIFGLNGAVYRYRQKTLFDPFAVDLNTLDNLPPIGF